MLNSYETAANSGQKHVVQTERISWYTSGDRGDRPARGWTGRVGEGARRCLDWVSFAGGSRRWAGSSSPAGRRILDRADARLSADHRGQPGQRQPRERGQAPKVPLRVVAVTPAPHAPAGRQRRRPGPGAVLDGRWRPAPRCRPSPRTCAGTWQRPGRHRRVRPDRRLPGVHLRPGARPRRRGRRPGQGRRAAWRTPRIVYFDTGAYSAARLTELLAQLGYLPLKPGRRPRARQPGARRAARPPSWPPPTRRRRAPSPGSRATRTGCRASGTTAAPAA